MNVHWKVKYAVQMRDTLCRKIDNYNWMKCQRALCPRALFHKCRKQHQLCPGSHWVNGNFPNGPWSFVSMPTIQGLLCLCSQTFSMRSTFSGLWSIPVTDPVFRGHGLHRSGSLSVGHIEPQVYLFSQPRILLLISHWIPCIYVF